MSIIFKCKYNNLVVRIIKPCSYITIDEFSEHEVENDPFKSVMLVTNSTLLEVTQKCVLCKDVNSDETYVIPILQFMNNFEPYDGCVVDMFRTIEKLKNLEDEEPANDIPQAA